MAHTRIRFNDNKRYCYVGYSFTVMFFGVIVSIFRKDWITFGLFILALGLSHYLNLRDNPINPIMVFLNSGIIMGFLYNPWHRFLTIHVLKNVPSSTDKKVYENITDESVLWEWQTIGPINNPTPIVDGHHNKNH